MGLTDFFKKKDTTVRRTCAVCGKQLDVPAELKEFSCVYCGAKMNLGAITAEGAPLAAAGQFTADDASYSVSEERQYAEEHILDCISKYEDYFKYFNRKDYSDHFDAYQRGTNDIFLAIDRLVREEPERRTEIIREFVLLFLDKREEYHRSSKHGKTKSGFNRLMFDSKIIIALYMVPAVYAMNYSVSAEFVDELHGIYMSRYPDNPFQPGTYTAITAGFRKSKFCFITTAVCEAEGKPDDCAELQTFRSFRDGWLSDAPGGKAQIAEYYRIAPAIVTRMTYTDDGAAVCAMLREQYLNPCYDALQRGDNKTCRKTYTAMVRDLKKRYRVS